MSSKIPEKVKDAARRASNTAHRSDERATLWPQVAAAANGYDQIPRQSRRILPSVTLTPREDLAR